MTGLYIHIPFCKKACTYCNFHFSTSRKGHQEMVDAIIQEIDARAGTVPATQWDTIYFGGGTPSLLSLDQINSLLAAAERARPIAASAEITLEANPDDLDEATLNALSATAINRLSIGIQSFREEDLRYMGRAHSAHEAGASIARAQAAGFHNLTIDLIYGTPGLTDEAWRMNIHQAIDFGIPHISAYALTVEPQTALAHLIKVGKSTPVDDIQSGRQMEILMEELAKAGYDHYEISNFALPNMRAQHNSNYWLGHPYLGVGPSAHSYDGKALRCWNIANNAKYVKGIRAGQPLIESEELRPVDRYNELVLTRLRTAWGLPIAQVQALGFEQEFSSNARTLIERNWLVVKDNIYTLTPQGKLFGDAVSEALFIVD